MSNFDEYFTGGCSISLKNVSTFHLAFFLELNDKYKGDKQLDYTLIKKKILNKDSVIMSIIMSRISLLISQLTSSYGERPIITPPSFMTSK